MEYALLFVGIGALLYAVRHLHRESQRYENVHTKLYRKCRKCHQMQTRDGSKWVSIGITRNWTCECHRDCH